MSDDTGHKMSRTELIIQLVEVALGLVIGAYFVWWSLEVLRDCRRISFPVPTFVSHTSTRRALRGTLTALPIRPDFGIAG